MTDQSGSPLRQTYRGGLMAVKRLLLSTRPAGVNPDLPACEHSAVLDPLRKDGACSRRISARGPPFASSCPPMRTGFFVAIAGHDALGFPSQARSCVADATFPELDAGWQPPHLRG